MPYITYRILLTILNSKNKAQQAWTMLNQERQVDKELAVLRQFYYDIALSSSPAALPSLLEIADPTHITYGSERADTADHLDLGAPPDIPTSTWSHSPAPPRWAEKVMAAAAVHGHRTQMELGGKAPFVVFDDADLDAAIQGAAAGAIINPGQDCTAATGPSSPATCTTTSSPESVRR